MATYAYIQNTTNGYINIIQQKFPAGPNHLIVILVLVILTSEHLLPYRRPLTNFLVEIKTKLQNTRAHYIGKRMCS